MALRNTNDLIRRSGYSDHWEMKKQILMTALFLWAIPLVSLDSLVMGRKSSRHYATLSTSIGKGGI